MARSTAGEYYYASFVGYYDDGLGGEFGNSTCLCQLSVYLVQYMCHEQV